jgi:hypothetical protein
MTVAELGALYVDKHAKPNKRSWAEDERLLKVEVYPAIGRMKAQAVKRRDLLDIVEAKAEDGKVAQARLLLATRPGSTSSPKQDPFAVDHLDGEPQRLLAPSRR